ncbi:hypothetical protein ACW6QP_06005 [Salegentibacter sp. HM20]
MKRSMKLIASIFMFALLFSSCSNEEAVQLNEPTQKSSINFGVMLNDLMNRSMNKQAIEEIPGCSDTDPAYVWVALQDADDNWVGGFNGDEDQFIEVPVAGFGPYGENGEDAWFTDESSELELEPGMYTLEYFWVFDSDDNLIWVTPRSGSELANFVDTALPLSINLGAGVKKYVDVEVLCFDDRIVNEYGYLFFDIIGVEAITFCVFGNFCDEKGRHFPAHFRLEIWTYSGDENNPKGSPLFNSEDPYINEVGTNNDGDLYATPLCIPLPDRGGEDWYYAEIYLLDWGNANDAGELIRSGVFSDEAVRNLYNDDDTNEYYHFREDCTGEDSPNIFDEVPGNGGGNGGDCNQNDPDADCDNDGVRNEIDECPDTDPGVLVNERGCESIQVPGRDIVVFNDVNIFDNGAMSDPDNVRLVQNLVNFTTTGSRNNGTVVMMDRGKGAQCLNDGACGNSQWNTFRQTMIDEGFSIEDVQTPEGGLTSIASNVKIIYLVGPVINYTLTEINTLKQFAAEGGRIIFVGEHASYYNGISVENQFLLNMGAVLHNTGGAIDCGYTTIPESSNREHPIMEGVGDLTIACASVIEPGPEDFPLFYDTTNTYVLAGVAKIDTNPISEFVSQNFSAKRQVISEKIQNKNSSTGY